MFKKISTMDNLSELMMQFESTIVEVEAIRVEERQARASWELKKEYLGLAQEYKTLVSSMLQSLLKAETSADTHRIKLACLEKINKVVNNLESLKAKMSGSSMKQIPADINISNERSLIQNQVDRLSALLTNAEDALKEPA